MSDPTVSVSYDQALVAVASPRVASAIADRPFPSADALVAAARDEWWGARVTDWLESFAAHPRIASKIDVADLTAKSRAYSSREQTGAAKASDDVKQQFAEWNARYDAKFGHIFMVYASGRSAESMLEELKQRYHNPPYAEVGLNAIEHMKITDRRLRALVVGALTPPASPKPSPPPSPKAASRLVAAMRRLRPSMDERRPPAQPAQVSFAFEGAAAAAAAAAVATAPPLPPDEGEEEPPPGYAPGEAAAAQLDSFAFAKPPELPAITTTGGEEEAGASPSPPPPPSPPPAPLRSAITTHVLDVALGRPAEGVTVTLCRRPPAAPAAAQLWAPLATRTTDADGRINDLLPPGAPPPPPGVYKLEFDTGAYVEATVKAVPGYGGGGAAFFPTAAVEFVVSPGRAHYHVPLTWSPYGYSTYRGS